MAFCPNCGAPIDEGAVFCASCGGKIDAAAPQQNQYQQAPVQEQPVGNTFDPADIESNKVYAILAYLGILVLVPILAAKDSKFAKFHANNGLVLLLAMVICGFLCSIPIVKYFTGIIELGIIIIDIIGLISAAKGEAKELPIISGIKIIK